MKVLEQTDVLVPTVHCFCRDAHVIRTPFYMMEFLDGRIFEEDWLPDITPEERGLMLVTPFLAMSKSREAVAMLTGIMMTRWRDAVRAWGNCIP